MNEKDLGSTHTRIYVQKGGCADKADFLALATLFVKLGYTVRIGKEKPPGAKTSTAYVEFVGCDGRDTS